MTTIFIVKQFINDTPTTKKEAYKFRCLIADNAVSRFEISNKKIDSIEWWRIFETEQKAIEYLLILGLIKK